MKHRVRGGAADSSRCINQTDYFTQTDFSDAYFNENNIVRIDSGLPQTDALGNPTRQQQCQDRESFRKWIQDQRQTIFPQNRQPFSPAQIAFLEGFYVGYHSMAAPAVVEVPQLQQLDAAQVQAWAQQMNAEIAQMRADRELLEDLDQIMMQAPAPTVIPGLLTEDDELEMGLSQLTLAPAQALAFVNAEAPQRFFRPSFDEDMD